MQVEGQTEEDLAFLMAHDPDDFSRWADIAFFMAAMSCLAACAAR